MNVRSRTIYFCPGTVHMCTWHMHCVRTVRSDIKCICHVYRGPLIVQKRSCARTISLARLRSGKWWLGGGPPATTITRVHFKHNQHMHVVATLLGRILGISLIVIPRFVHTCTETFGAVFWTTPTPQLRITFSRLKGTCLCISQSCESKRT